MKTRESENLNKAVREYWEQEVCGTSSEVIGDGDISRGSQEWYEQIEEHRYSVEPFIHSVAQFTRHSGKKVLEVGVGAGTDHLQWARAGAICSGVDLTDAAIETTKARLSIYGYESDLSRIDAEILPFSDDSFDTVYSWGVIHHSKHPERIISEIHRVLKPDGVFIGMLYGRRSLRVLKLWIKYALLKGKPWLSFSNVVWHNMESVGTKAYTIPEIEALFSKFGNVSTESILTSYDLEKWPAWITGFFSRKWGWNIAVIASKRCVE